LRQQLGNWQAVKDMAIPDTFAFSGSDEAALNTCAREKLGKCPNFGLTLWEVAAD
jgi:hypothetical protein